jgi:hypothetical protein
MPFTAFIRTLDRAADFMSDRVMMDFITIALALSFPRKSDDTFMGSLAHTFVLIFILTAVRHLLKVASAQLQLNELSAELGRLRRGEHAKKMKESLVYQ